MVEVVEFGADVWERWKKQKPSEADRREEVQALAHASAERVEAAVQAAIQDEAAGQPAAVKRQLTTYLIQVQVRVQRILCRPADPEGRTVPADLRRTAPRICCRFCGPSRRAGACRCGSGWPGACGCCRGGRPRPRRPQWVEADISGRPPGRREGAGRRQAQGRRQSEAPRPRPEDGQEGQNRHPGEARECEAPGTPAAFLEKSGRHAYRAILLAAVTGRMVAYTPSAERTPAATLTPLRFLTQVPTGGPRSPPCRPRGITWQPQWVRIISSMLSVALAARIAWKPITQVPTNGPRSPPCRPPVMGWQP